MHLMLDLETWGKSPGCAIRSIGAVAFDPHNDTHSAMFYTNVDDPWGTRDTETVAWWDEQSLDAQSVFSENVIPLRTALTKLTAFYKSNNCKRLWCHGAGFDAPIIECSYSLAWMRREFFTQYMWVRDTRTIYELAGEKPISLPGFMTKHHALHDAVNQAAAVQRSYKKLSIKV